MGRKLVNEFCEFFRAVRLKTVVRQTDITSRKVIHLFCFIDGVDNVVCGKAYYMAIIRLWFLSFRHEGISVARYVYPG